MIATLSARRLALLAAAGAPVEAIAISGGAGRHPLIRQMLADAVGLPVLATCAGLIYCARELDNPAPGQQTLGLLDVTVRRNAFGNQRFSAERTVDVVVAKDQSLPIEASFIRAPLVTRLGEGVEVIATVPGEDGDAVVGVRQGRVTALSFHPEENGDARVHAAWLDSF